MLQEELSNDAISLLSNKFENKNLILVVEFLEHDGYDRKGPQSNLLDLYIIDYDSTNNFIVYNYHWEDRFYYHKCDEEPLLKYELYSKKPILEINHNTYDKLKKYVNKSSYMNLKEEFENIGKKFK
jgi:hypothetical protein